MGTLTLSGVLKRPISGDVVPDARITFDAIATGNIVLKGVSSACRTASDGSYTVDLEYGDYSIQVSWAGQTQQYGIVHVDDTTPIGSLNDLLMQQIMELQLTPEIILEFRLLEQEMQEELAQMEVLNTQASDSATSAGESAGAAAISESNSANSEEAAAASAVAAGASEINSANSEEAAAVSAAAAGASEINSANSEEAAAASAAAAGASEEASGISAKNAGISERNAAISEDNAALSASEAATSARESSASEVNAAISSEAAATSETNAENARDAAEEYAQEAKEASSKVTDPLTDQGLWAIQSGYPVTPGVASIWQITDGGVDPLNDGIIWDPGDMLVYLASSGAWCRLLGQQVVTGEPVPLRFDSDIILNVGTGLQIISTGTIPVDVARLDANNNLVVGDANIPGIVLNVAAPTNLFVLTPDGSGGFTKSRIYTEVFPPPSIDTSHFVPDSRKINGHKLTQNVDLVAKDIDDLGTAATYNITTSNKDLTPGRVMKVGDYGLGVANGSAPYLNSIYDIKCSGEYNALGDGTSTPTTGVPSGSGNTRFAVSAGNIYPNQYLVTLTGNVHFYVGVVDTENKTSTWSTFYNTLNKPSANDVGAIPAAIVGSISNNGSMANAKINGWWQVSVSDPKTVPGFPKYANGTYLYGYGYMFVWIQGNTWFQLFYGHHGANATRQNWTAGPDTATDWIVTYNEANPPPATDLSAYMKTADANARFITGIRMANYATNGSEGLSDSAHRVMTGIWASNGWDNPSTQSSRQIQFQIAGSWYNAAYV